jgi:hypothetical protein
MILTMPAPCGPIIIATIPVHPNSIILIKRTRKRVMQKFNAIQQLVENFANEQRLEFVNSNRKTIYILV